jgi:hypothetical protein
VAVWHLHEEQVRGMEQRQLQLRASVWEALVSTWGKEDWSPKHRLKLTAIGVFQRRLPGTLPRSPKLYAKPKPTDFL